MPGASTRAGRGPDVRPISFSHANVTPVTGNGGFFRLDFRTADDPAHRAGVSREHQISFRAHFLQGTAGL